MTPTTTPTTLPQLSLTGNAIGLALNATVTYWAWGKGGWYRVAVVLGALNSLYFVGKIQKQL
jgi:hypothetical protein